MMPVWKVFFTSFAFTKFKTCQRAFIKLKVCWCFFYGQKIWKALTCLACRMPSEPASSRDQKTCVTSCIHTNQKSFLLGSSMFYVQDVGMQRNLVSWRNDSPRLLFTQFFSGFCCHERRSNSTNRKLKTLYLWLDTRIQLVINPYQ